MTINLNPNTEERRLLTRIAERALALKCGGGVHTEMDLAATHLNGCPLRLQELLDASDVNFIHDITGIHRHLDRSTGRLTNCFEPRYAERS